MKHSEIATMELFNSEGIYLHEEGLFLRAYNNSAKMLCDMHPELKVLARRLKDGAEVVYVGFPKKDVVKWLGCEPEPSGRDKLFLLPLKECVSQKIVQEWMRKVMESAEAKVSEKRSKTVLSKEMEGVVESILNYDIADRTLIESLQFLYDIRQKLLNAQGK